MKALYTHAEKYFDRSLHSLWWRQETRMLNARRFAAQERAGHEGCGDGPICSALENPPRKDCPFSMPPGMDATSSYYIHHLISYPQPC